MKKISFQFLVVLILLAGCKDEGSITDPTDPDVTVSAIYGVGVDQKAILSWEITAVSHATRLMIYRHTTPAFTEGNAVHIAEINLLSMAPTLAYIVDSSLSNGTKYQYTIVPEALESDGGIKRGEHKTTSIIPFDPASVPTNQIQYSEHIQPIFNGGCAMHGCHEGEAGSVHHKFQKTSHGGSEFSLTSWANALSGTDDVAQIVPYRARKSHIIQHLNRDTAVAPAAQPSMPPGFQFPEELRDLLIRWIDDGAKNDDGTTAYSTMPSRGRLYVTNEGEDITAVVDLDQHKIGRFITTGVNNVLTNTRQAPHNVVVDWQNNYYYVNLINAGKILKFSVSDNQKVNELTSGVTSPAQIALSKNSDTAYVTNFFSSNGINGKISIVNTQSMTVIGEVGSPAMSAPHGVSITPNFRYIIVSNAGSDNVTVVNSSDMSIEKIIPLSGNVPALPIQYSARFEPYQSVITPDNRYVYVTCRKSNEVRVIDLNQWKVIDSITVGLRPLVPSISPDGQFVFVPNRNSHSVSIISTATPTDVKTIDSVGVEPHGSAVSKDGKYLYVSCENIGLTDPPHHPTAGGIGTGFVKIIDIASRAVVKSLEVGYWAAGIALTN